MSSDKFKEGAKAGGQWFKSESKKSAFQQMGGFGIKNPPHRTGDAEFNKGLREGIRSARNKK